MSVALPLAIVALLGLQFLLGFRVLRLEPVFSRKVHALSAAALVALFAYHGFSPLLGYTSASVGMSPIDLPVGFLLIALLAVEILVGFKVIRLDRRFRLVHVTLAVAIVLLGSAHGVTIASGASHPSAAACASCHRGGPAGHPLAQCEKCHDDPGRSWSYRPVSTEQ